MLLIAMMRLMRLLLMLLTMFDEVANAFDTAAVVADDVDAVNVDDVYGVVADLLFSRLLQ